jgi:hypothetical protein
MVIASLDMGLIDRTRTIGFTVFPKDGGEHRFAVTVDDGKHDRLREIVDQLQAELNAELKRTLTGWLSEA